MPAATSSMLVPDWVLVTTILALLPILPRPQPLSGFFLSALSHYNTNVLPLKPLAPTRERDPPVTGAYRQHNCFSTGNGFSDLHDFNRLRLYRSFGRAVRA